MTGFQDIEISITQQCMFFLCSAVLGTVIGMIYDVFRIIRIAFRHNFIVVFFEDLLFCFITCVLLILMIFCANYGVVRWFSVFGCAGGFFIYRETAGRIVIRASDIIISFIRRYIILPLVRLCGLLSGFIVHALCFAVVRIKFYLFLFRLWRYRCSIVRKSKKGFGL
ncbi:MAG: hypothetical protein E7588_04160 [Ruminococcaceae bacterium]|nr:hypothetical protein [Oscillospiraceae bacterium]